MKSMSECTEGVKDGKFVETHTMQKGFCTLQTMFTVLGHNEQIKGVL